MDFILRCHIGVSVPRNEAITIFVTTRKKKRFVHFLLFFSHFLNSDPIRQFSLFTTKPYTIYFAIAHCQSRCDASHFHTISRRTTMLQRRTRAAITFPCQQWKTIPWRPRRQRTALVAIPNQILQCKKNTLFIIIINIIITGMIVSMHMILYNNNDAS